jgi:hypothetical protein
MRKSLWTSPPFVTLTSVQTTRSSSDKKKEASTNEALRHMYICALCGVPSRQHRSPRSGLFEAGLFWNRGRDSLIDADACRFARWQEKGMVIDTIGETE